MSWYYVNKDGFTVGPKTVSELKPLYASKTITESTFVWNGTTVDTWTALKKVSPVYRELAPERMRNKSKARQQTSSHSHSHSHSRSKSKSRKLLKKPSKLSVISKLTKSKSHDHNDDNNHKRSRSKSSKSSRFSSLKLSKKDKKNTTNNNNNNTQRYNKASTPRGTKSSRSHQHQHQHQRQRDRDIQQQQPAATRNHYHQEPIRMVQHRGSNSSSISVSTGSESANNRHHRLPKGADGTERGTFNNIDRPPSLSSINFSVSTANRSHFFKSKSHGNLLRAGNEAPELYSAVSADDIDVILDEIEDNERKQQHVFSKIKGKLIKSYTAHTQRSNNNSPKKANNNNKHKPTNQHQRGQSVSHQHQHKHGAHCTHCHYQHKPSSSSNTTKVNTRRPGHGRAGSEPIIIDFYSITDIPWGHLTSTPSSGKRVQAENINMIRKIITHSKHIDINTQNPRDGTTLIMHAIIIGDYNLVEELLRNGASHIIQDKDGDDCIDYALLFQRYKIAELLLMVNKKMTNKRIKAITKKWEKEAEYMADNVFGKFKDNIIDFVCKTIQNKGVIGDDMIFKAWYFTLHSTNKVTGNETQPHFSESKLFKTMLAEFGKSMKDRRKNKETWQWIRKYLIQSIIWLLPHPENDIDDDEESDDDETDLDDSEVGHGGDDEYESKESKGSVNIRMAMANASSSSLRPDMNLNAINTVNYHGKGYGLDGSRGGGVSRSRTPLGSATPSQAGDHERGATINTMSTLHESSQDESMGFSQVKFVPMDIQKPMDGDKLLLFLFL